MLIRYLPTLSVLTINKWIKYYNIQLKITGNRVTKFGDFMPKRFGQEFHKISINGDLDKQSFLFTFIHEFAHVLVWNRYKGSVKPHGKEWKKCFGQLLEMAVDNHFFDTSLKSVITKHSKCPKSSQILDVELYRALRKHKELIDDESVLETLSVNALFLYKQKRFKKIRKLRKNILCLNLQNNREYVFNLLTRVSVI